MTYEQIAHDLAVAKLCGSDLPAEELINQYRQYYQEILSVLKSGNPRVAQSRVVKNPISKA